MRERENSVWSVPVRLEDVPEGGRTFALSADEPTRRAIADLAHLRALPRLDGRFDITRYGRDGLRIAGEISATVGQTCVVTLEPIENEVHEFFDLVFKPATAVDRPLQDTQADEAVDVVALDALDPPEPLVDGAADLGAIATEFLLLGIDPYPRKSGVVFEAPAVEDGASGPFSALAALKRDKSGGESG